MLLKLTEHFKKPELWNWKMYRAVVLNNEDPTKIKRVKVAIDGIFPAESVGGLPWVTALLDSPKTVNVPEVGDELCVIFPFDDVYHPVYIGYWNTGTTGQSYLQDDYPNTFGFIYANLKARFNKSTKIGEIVHGTGTSIAIDASGNITITGKKLTLNNSDEVEIISSGNVTISSSGDMNLTATGMFVGKGTGGTTIGDAGSVTTVLGSMVNLGKVGGSPVALVGVSLVQGIGNAGFPVFSQILTGSSTVFASP